MKRLNKIALALTGATLLATPVIAADTGAGVKIGTLTCAVEGETNFIVGSNAALNCTFEPANGGQAAYYTGTVREFGLDIGTTTNATLVWGVLAPSADMEAGALEGEYGGVTAGASLGAGVKANALIGGFDKSIALNPVSVESQTGTNLTLGVSYLSLKSVS
ncbi:DUF992 domain-containing protein [Labrenzia sp. 011]|uniref:DUF992 domain-containing protein n=1 Tax=Labrenzia sp. 011 TaxID=2171494 RepID=UPI000D51A951|nr:DUF992 domain-containing protein [Labrenzia sp. 011]PVB59627.1 DUF992 domain-containing protein [Labrenzia sp. 011]